MVVTQSCGNKSSVDEVLKRLVLAYEAGRQSMVAWDVELERQEWATALRYRNMSHLQRNEQDVLCKTKIHCVRARKAAGGRNFPSACREIALAQMISDNTTLCKEARLLADSEILAVEATIEFWDQNYPLARQKLFANSAVDQTLEAHFGIASFHAHRIHLLSKHVQLASFAAGPQQALRIAARSMSYLNGGSLDFQEAGDWTQSRIAKLSAGIRRFLVRQLTVEIGAALLYANERCKREAVQDFFSILSPEQIGSIVDPMSKHYLNALHLSGLSNHHLDHISAAADVLNCGAKGVETLWAMCLLDAGQSCARINSDAARYIQQLSLEYASQHTAFPVDLRQSWQQRSHKVQSYANHHQ